MVITTPVNGFSGLVVGVMFVDGRAEVPDDAPALAYFTRHGYGIGPSRAQGAPAENVEEPQEPVVAETDQAPAENPEPVVAEAVAEPAPQRRTTK